MYLNILSAYRFYVTAHLQSFISFMPKSEYSNEDNETLKQLTTDYTLLLDNTMY